MRPTTEGKNIVLNPAIWWIHIKAQKKFDPVAIVAGPKARIYFFNPHNLVASTLLNFSRPPVE